MTRIIYWTSLNNISHSAIYYKTILNEQRETEENSFKVVPLASNTFCVMFDDFYRNWNQNTIVMAQREKQSWVNNIGIVHVKFYVQEPIPTSLLEGDHWKFWGRGWGGGYEAA